MNMKYFKPVNFFKFESMSEEFLRRLDIFRELLGWPVILTSSNKPGGHSPSSMHYAGKAIDFRTKADKAWVLTCAQRLFSGIGYYSNGYWHTDSRPLGIGAMPAMWFGLNVGKEIEYVPWNITQFREYFLQS